MCVALSSLHLACLQWLSALCASDQWDVQATIKRVVASLKKRGYVVWFGANRLQSLIDIARDPFSPVRCTDLESMKGSVVDA